MIVDKTKKSPVHEDLDLLCNGAKTYKKQQLSY